MINRAHELPISRQAKPVAVSRGSFYYEAKAVNEPDLAIMRQIDELHLEYPFAGSRMLRLLLRNRGFHVGRRHVVTLMRRMRIEALYRKRSTSRRDPSHTIFPYLLRGLLIEKPIHVWCADITYIPMSRGFLYLFAVMDWATRRILAWRLSNTMATDFCVDAIEEAAARYDAPEIFNTDQGTQFTAGDSSSSSAA